MVSKRSGCVLLICLLAAAFAPATAASSHATTGRKATFAPQSHVASRKSEEVDFSLPTRNSLLQHVIAARGGAGSTTNDAIAGAVGFFAIDAAVRKIFEANDISFPSQLGGCIILFVAMVLGELIIPGLGDKVFSFLNPGALLLAKWLPAFFVPGLAMLPLAPSVGSPFEVVKVLAVGVIGFLFTISTTAYTVLGMRTAMGAVEAPVASKPSKSKETKAAAPPAKPYSEGTLDFLVKGSVLSGAISIAATRTNFESATLLQTIYMSFVTFASFVWGARLPSSFTKVVHPLVTSTMVIWIVMGLTAAVTGSTFLDVLRSYKVGSMEVTKTGAGDILLYLLGPSVVSFAMSMYSKKDLLKDNLLVAIAAMLVSSVGGLFGTAAFGRLIKLGGAGDNFLRRSVLTRNVTTALAIAATAILEGDIAICASVVVLTGIIGGTFGRSVLTAMGITDPVSRGLAIGASSQGLGVAAIASEEDAFPFAAISMVLTAISATTLVSIPAVKDALINLATGA